MSNCRRFRVKQCGHHQALRTHADLSTPSDIARIASTNGQYAASITDHGTMGGVLKFQDACKKTGVKPIFGIEAYFVDSVGKDSQDRSERSHLILLAKSNQGLQKLYKASQIGWQKNFYYKPRLDFALLEDLVDDDIERNERCHDFIYAIHHHYVMLSPQVDK